MNNIAYAQAVQAVAKPKFRGHKVLKSKVVTHYPDNLAREYTRITNRYMTLLNKTLAEHLPVIRKAIDAERNGMRHDDNRDVLALIEQEFMRIAADFGDRLNKFELENKLLNLSNLALNHKIREWKRIVRKTIGINIMEDYYRGEFFRQQLKIWTQANVDLISRIPKNTLTQMRNIIEDGFRNGRTNTDIGREIQDVYGIGRRHAQFIARDQMATLNSDITRQQQQDAGVKSYTWSDSGDGRVRDCHAEFHGKQFDWNNPPMNWYDTKTKGRVYTEPFHPGEAPGCRCVALPLFDIENLNLPWDSGEKGEPYPVFSL